MITGSTQKHTHTYTMEQSVQESLASEIDPLSLKGPVCVAPSVYVYVLLLFQDTDSLLLSKPPSPPPFRSLCFIFSPVFNRIKVRKKVIA